eukprot:4216376-Alexandrium_andersonii.AAC.1
MPGPGRGSPTFCGALRGPPERSAQRVRTLRCPQLSGTARACPGLPEGPLRCPPERRAAVSRGLQNSSARSCELAAALRICPGPVRGLSATLRCSAEPRDELTGCSLKVDPWPPLPSNLVHSSARPSTCVLSDVRSSPELPGACPELSAALRCSAEPRDELTGCSLKVDPWPSFPSTLVRVPKCWRHNRWPLARQEQRIVRSADWRIADWEPAKLRFRGFEPPPSPISSAKS